MIDTKKTDTKINHTIYYGVNPTQQSYIDENDMIDDDEDYDSQYFQQYVYYKRFLRLLSSTSYSLYGSYGTDDDEYLNKRSNLWPRLDTA